MRGNDQQAYDRGTSLFSPDGRIYQVEYAREAVSRGAPSVGIRTAEGIVLAAMSRTSSPLMEAESIEKLHKLDDHVATASAGHVADARKLIDLARQQTQVNQLRYGEPVGIETLTKHVTDHIQENTQLGGTRPYGAALLIGGIENGEPRLFGADPSGTPHEWKATVIGDGREEIQSTLEENWTDSLTLEDGIELAVTALGEYADDLTAADLSIATITEADGYRVVSEEDIADVVPDLPADADAVDDEEETADETDPDGAGDTGTEEDADDEPTDDDEPTNDE
ncbi:proteasome alpha subunit [Halopenitus malekzadehii]|uniref:Proteasome subunit alpha n=1 Tax=Halopenitus malekzadehii TaxID=1267564 RepID=A0A1H6IE22_9EURY|nr:archaeal proteasome endopeptidase complex subunit alpha [Halopenitus malekzadehii]SEH47085.1 proteasome alpha subunit [Halopenitus malekzadehii]